MALNGDSKTTVYEFPYLGTYYYTKEKPILQEKGFTPIRVITDLYRRYPIAKTEIAKRLGIKSTSLIVIRKKTIMALKTKFGKIKDVEISLDQWKPSGEPKQQGDTKLSQQGGDTDKSEMLF